MGSDYGGTVSRFAKGDVVWVSPAWSGEWLTDDEAIILEDVGSGYLVLQDTERVPSYGQGHYVSDTELSQLYDVPQMPMLEFPPAHEHVPWELDIRTSSSLRSICHEPMTTQQRLLVHS